MIHRFTCRSLLLALSQKFNKYRCSILYNSSNQRPHGNNIFRLYSLFMIHWPSTISSTHKGFSEHFFHQTSTVNFSKITSYQTSMWFVLPRKLFTVSTAPLLLKIIVSSKVEADCFDAFRNLALNVCWKESNGPVLGTCAFPTFFSPSIRFYRKCRYKVQIANSWKIWRLLSAWRWISCTWSLKSSARESSQPGSLQYQGDYCRCATNSAMQFVMEASDSLQLVPTIFATKREDHLCTVNFFWFKHFSQLCIRI